MWAQADHPKLTPGLARKASEDPLFGEELPWEVCYDNLYANVIFDPTDNLYKCWYDPFIFDVATTDTPPVQRERGPSALCWPKPAGLAAKSGSTAGWSEPRSSMAKAWPIRYRARRMSPISPCSGAMVRT